MQKKNEKTTTISQSRYRTAEIIKSAHRFGVAPECVEAALKIAGRREATLEEATKIISDFMDREVK